MSRQLLVYLAMIALILTAGCAEKNTAYEDADVFDLISVVPVVGNPTDLARDDTHMYVALDQGGMAAIDLQSFQSHWYTTAPAEDGSVTKFKQTRIVSVVPEYGRLFLNEITGTDMVWIMDSNKPDSLLIIDSITGGTFDIKDFLCLSLEEPVGDHVIEVLYCDSGNIYYNLYNSTLWVGFGFTIPNLPLRLSGIDMDDSYIYAAAEQRGIFIYDKVDGTYVSESPVYGEPQKLKVVDGIAYIASRQGGLQIVDLTDPHNPQTMGGYVTSGYASQVDYHDGKVAVSSGSGGAYVFDVTNPNDPQLIQRITECGYANSVNFDGGILTIGSRDDGIFFYQMN